MKTLSALFVSVVLFGASMIVGCSETSTVADMSQLNADGCLGVLNCAAACAGVVSCIQACEAKGTTTAQTKFMALIGCARMQCLTAGDAGAPPCSSVTDTSMACAACGAVQAQSAACSTQLAACAGDM